MAGLIQQEILNELADVQSFREIIKILIDAIYPEAEKNRLIEQLNVINENPLTKDISVMDFKDIILKSTPCYFTDLVMLRCNMLKMLEAQESKLNAYLSSYEIQIKNQEERTFFS